MAKKRGNNEGSILRRKNGTWRAQVTLEGRRLSFSAKTRQECQEWVKKTLGQIENGLTFSGASATIEEFLDGWLTSIEYTLRPRSITQYRQISRVHIIPSLGKLKLKDLRPEHIQALYDSKLQAGVGPRTVQLIHAVLHRALVHAVRLGVIGRNPADAVTRPKTEHKEMLIFDENQVNLFLIAARGNRNEALYHLAITTGLRQSELLALQWADLDWEKRTLLIRRQLKKNFLKGDQFAPLKTKYGRRTIVLGPRTIEKLRDQWKQQQVERQSVGDRWEEHDLIFTSSVGTPINQSNLLKDFKELVQAAGLPMIRFHDLRHTAASLMLNHDVPVIVASRRLGHSRPSITLDIYGHLMPGSQNEAAEILDELVTPVEIHIGIEVPNNSAQGVNPT